MNRRMSPIDHFIANIDQGVRTIFGRPDITERPNPAADVDEPTLSEAEKRHSAGLMRVNHAGEIAAQALYQGQALTARNTRVREQMERSAQEENDHLDWCETRLRELDSHTSYLAPFWYTGSLLIGAVAGASGDKWSLGFVVETERQVEKHLEDHLEDISSNDTKSRAIIEQMKADEIHHADVARKAGGADLPPPIKTLMKITSKVMTKTAYRF
ncbi:MAG: 2-polyprenyl-3-methyl-6-methoxy-1,4-benzoquinone monooxygenase [Gammaproteobacteria bacterium]|nr:2-polyprenyl-3-methyl-6-methoxy-1,4-benzoquinone monooxygenase [Gammaproteobacteria bacterium]